MIIYEENSKEFPKNLHQIYKFSKLSGSKVNMRTQLCFYKLAVNN
jgi:hypothetical protein